jgi:hypothetical protein
MAFALVFYYIREVHESDVFEESGGSESPLKELFRGQNLWSFLQVFVLMGGFWLTLYTASAMLPGLLTSELGVEGTRLTITLAVAFLILAGAYMAAGVISQKVGRFRTGVRASGFGLGYSLAVIPPAFYAFYQAGLASFMPFKYTPLPLLVIGALLMLIGAVWGPETKDVDFHEEVGAAPEAGARGEDDLARGAQAPPGTERNPSR